MTAVVSSMAKAAGCQDVQVQQENTQRVRTKQQLEAMPRKGDPSCDNCRLRLR